ncbi:MAG TPA: TIGR03936 family radical SAM-associated protein [Jatrophihabitans sp.]|jgi:radical SAM-linked protein
MARRTPDGPPPPPVVQRLRIRYAKRGRLRFTSHRDFARAFERALRRAEVPMAYSGGFSPHPKISYAGAAPTGVASEAEYLEIGLARESDPEQIRAAIDAALPDGLDILEIVPASPGGNFADRLQAAHWHIELPGVDPDRLHDAVVTLLGKTELTVQRLTKDGRRDIDVRHALVSAKVGPSGGRAIMEVVVRQVTPTVRPDDILAALRIVGDLAPEAPAVSVRVAQGPLDETGKVSDPLIPDRPPARRTP